ncbi:Coatomer beta subunit [Parasponia andersonii]|uniref:Coatomer beta subunit n=1 Tax=Parasponia andersonii TaxID=3476 RepID=A0A2P5B1Q8_PARAD|nr:Coatomer beta subunit [Parasponia andersonii]
MEKMEMKQETPPVLKVLEALKQACRDLEANPSLDSDDSNSSAIKALLELETESDTILSKDPNLSTLSQLLARLKTLVQTLQSSRARHGLASFLTRRVSTHSLSRVAAAIGSEIQAWIDRESVGALTRALRDPFEDEDEDELARLLTQFEDRVSVGFDRELQDLVLKSKLFSSLESILCNPSSSSRRIREHSAMAIAGLIRFNKDVFVGQVLMGPTIKALVTMASARSIGVLCSLIRSIKSPLVDEIESNGQIPKIMGLLSSQDLAIRVLAFDCVLEIGYFGRKEAIDAMLEEDLIRKLVELQRSELDGDLIDLGQFENEDGDDGDEDNREMSVGGVQVKKTERRRRREEKGFLESHPFASCVARFAVQLEVGEGLRQRERRAFKQQILVRVREASVSDAEAATIVAEVLWGSSP